MIIFSGLLHSRLKRMMYECYCFESVIGEVENFYLIHHLLKKFLLTPKLHFKNLNKVTSMT